MSFWCYFLIISSSFPEKAKLRKYALRVGEKRFFNIWGGQRGTRDAPKRDLNKEQRQGHQKGQKKDPKKHENDIKKVSKTEGKTRIHFSCFMGGPFGGEGPLRAG